MKPSKIVIDHLLKNTNFTDKYSFHDSLMELAEAFESIPENVYEAYEKLTEYEMWEIVRKLAVEGKKRYDSNDNSNRTETAGKFRAWKWINQNESELKKGYCGYITCDTDGYFDVEIYRQNSRVFTGWNNKSLSGTKGSVSRHLGHVTEWEEITEEEYLSKAELSKWRSVNRI
ncbi:hypothetical protein M5X17_31030 [Paenibacillus alvei]|uniref:hypothetical protein n=1 Tax=Paenibacillus alvei TaxID=44250 RepID=UPI00228062D8|nr:hypothetical protein [Paenibacillus alvei]MCY9738127.1 hypothetical protein [Paenibacillus alvei]